MCSHRVPVASGNLLDFFGASRQTLPRAMNLFGRRAKMIALTADSQHDFGVMNVGDFLKVFF